MQRAHQYLTSSLKRPHSFQKRRRGAALRNGVGEVAQLPLDVPQFCVERRSRIGGVLLVSMPQQTGHELLCDVRREEVRTLP